MRRLIEQVFVAAFDNPALSARHDSAVLEVPGGRLAMTSDGYVVAPRFFPGGDIGELAIYGTVNDLAMAGAEPRWLAAGFVLEEGLPLAELERIVASMARAAEHAGVAIVTGDTKVVDRGKGDGVFIHTTGVGVVADGLHIAPDRVQPGDAVLVSGDIGRHGIAVMSVREGLRFESELESDCAPLWPQVSRWLEAGVELHCLRDLTRGGLNAALNEIATDAGLDIAIDEASLPVHDAVRGACELLGLEPTSVACEGRMVAFVAEQHAERALELLRQHSGSHAPARIGHVSARTPAERPGRVTLRSAIGQQRVLDLPAGEQLPRIC
jgi:hydrogenase expression/formation protein HypE